MDSSKGPAHVTASVTIKGPADELLGALQSLRGGERTVHLSVEVPTRHYWDRDHYLPGIKNGQIQAALEKLETMSRQTVIDDETDRRLERLIREFGAFTNR